MDAPIDLNLLRAFTAVHTTGSFSAAAAKLGVPRSTVSRAVSSLEEILAVRLFQRTTRTVSITTAGAALFERVVPALSLIERAVTDLPEQAAVPTGLVRVTATVDLGSAVLAEAVARFTARYPGTRVEVIITSRVVNLIDENVDLALRVLAKSPRDSTLVARKVGMVELRLYAAPSYLARRGTPRSPEDLATHDWVAIRGAEALTLTGSRGRAKLEGARRILGDDMSFNREVLRAGAGIGVLASFFAEGDVTEGTLVRVMPKWVAFSGTVYLVQPSRKHVPTRVTAFRDLLIELLRRRPLSPLPAPRTATVTLTETRPARRRSQRGARGAAGLE